MAHIGFDKLARKIAKEYEKKGVTKKKAVAWGKDTAADVWRAKRKKK